MKLSVTQLHECSHFVCIVFVECLRSLQMKTGLNAPIVKSGTTVTRVSRFLLVLFVNQMSGTVCFVCN